MNGIGHHLKQAVKLTKDAKNFKRIASEWARVVRQVSTAEHHNSAGGVLQVKGVTASTKVNGAHDSAQTNHRSEGICNTIVVDSTDAANSADYRTRSSTATAATAAARAVGAVAAEVGGRILWVDVPFSGSNDPVALAFVHGSLSNQRKF